MDEKKMVALRQQGFDYLASELIRTLPDDAYTLGRLLTSIKYAADNMSFDMKETLAAVERRNGLPTRKVADSLWERSPKSEPEAVEVDSIYARKSNRFLA